MLAPPAFTSIQQHVSSFENVAFWQPYLDEILERHGLSDKKRELANGFNSTHPTFLCDDVIVKLFGYSEGWRLAHSAERAAHHALASDREIAAPELLGEGQLFEDPSLPWPYLITRRVAGTSWRNANLTPEQQRSVVAELGHQVKRLHALRPSGVASHEDWQPRDVAASNASSSLPPHLRAQIDAFLRRLDPFDRVMVHGDVVANHVFVDGGKLSGLIDWGDAIVTDRHYELIQPHRDMFDCDRGLLRLFLDASDWPVGKNFARQALGLALHRQAIGIVQHHSMDVFEPVAALLPLNDIATLDELAHELFGV